MAHIKIATNLILLLGLAWDKETSYYRKYGLGRDGPRSLSEASGVVRNILIYTKEFLMPKKL